MKLAVPVQLDRVRDELLQHCHADTEHPDETSAPAGRGWLLLAASVGSSIRPAG
jgi:hypothetical protein